MSDELPPGVPIACWMFLAPIVTAEGLNIPPAAVQAATPEQSGFWVSRGLGFEDLGFRVSRGLR